MNSSHAESSTQGSARETMLKNHSRRSQKMLANQGVPSITRLPSFRSALSSTDAPTPTPILSPTPGDSEPNTPGTNGKEVKFELIGAQYVYRESYHNEWVEWWETTDGCTAFTARYKGKRIFWDSNLRGSEVWSSFVQCARATMTAQAPEGWPGVQCLLCSVLLMHPAAGGTSSMRDHLNSKKCMELGKRPENHFNPIKKRFAKGTKVNHLIHILVKILTPLTSTDWLSTSGEGF